MGHVSAVASPREGDHFIRACLDTYTATCTKFNLEIEVDGDSILHLIDLFLRYRINRIQFKGINRACDDTVTASGAPF